MRCTRGGPALFTGHSTGALASGPATQAQDAREHNTRASGDAQGHAGAAGRVDSPDDPVCVSP